MAFVLSYMIFINSFTVKLSGLFMIGGGAWLVVNHYFLAFVASKL